MLTYQGSSDQRCVSIFAEEILILRVKFDLALCFLGVYTPNRKNVLKSRTFSADVRPGFENVKFGV